MPQFQALGIGFAGLPFLGYYELASWIDRFAAKRDGPTLKTYLHWAGGSALSPNLIAWDIARFYGADWDTLERVQLDVKQVGFSAPGEFRDTKREYRRWTTNIALCESARTIRSNLARSPSAARSAGAPAFTKHLEVKFLISARPMTLSVPGSIDPLEFGVILGAGWVKSHFDVSESVTRDAERRALFKLRYPALHCGQFP